MTSLTSIPARETTGREVSFSTTRQEFATIQQIIDRASGLGWRGDRMSAHMDLAAVHANGCPLDFVRLLTFPDFDFMHDFSGINARIDRNTGKLMDFFVPRCARRNS